MHSSSINVFKRKKNGQISCLYGVYDQEETQKRADHTDQTGLTFGAIRFLVCIGRYRQVANFQGHRASKQIDLGKENSLATSCSTSLMKSGLLDCSNSQTKNLSYLAKNPDFHLSWQHNFLARFVKLHINDISDKD